MEERIEQNERQIKASAEIDEEFQGDRLAKDFKQLEKSTGSMTAHMQLLALSRRWACCPPPAPHRISSSAQAVRGRTRG
jgi:hypothetical protein